MKPILSCLFVALTSSLVGCRPAASKALLQPSEALGTVLARETARLAGPKKAVAIISPDASWGPTSTAETAFVAELKRAGVKPLAAKAANVGDPMRSGEVGLRAADLFEVLDKFKDAGAVVSFAGTPLLKPADRARLATDHPPIVVVATASLGTVPGVPGDRMQLATLLDAKLVRMAVIDGQDPSVGPGRDSAGQEFSSKYRILRAAD